MVPGWHPVAWGRGCLLIGNSDKPLPEREERGWKRKLSRPPTPRGLVGLAGRGGSGPPSPLLFFSPFLSALRPPPPPLLSSSAAFPRPPRSHGVQRVICVENPQHLDARAPFWDRGSQDRFGTLRTTGARDILEKPSKFQNRQVTPNPTSPLGVGGLESFLFQPPSSHSGRGLPLPLPPPLDPDGAPREGLERPIWPKMAPRGHQGAQDGLQDRSG